MMTITSLATILTLSKMPSAAPINRIKAQPIREASARDYDLSITGVVQQGYHPYLKFEWQKYKDASAGSQISVPKLSLINNDDNSIIISVTSRMDIRSYPICSGDCDMVVPSDAIQLPVDLIDLGETKSLIISTKGTKDAFTLESKGYQLFIIDSDGDEVHETPHYPEDVRSVTSVYAGEMLNQSGGNSRELIRTKGDVCKSYSPETIEDRLRDANVILAKDTYSGIEKVRPKEVLVISNLKRGAYNGQSDDEASFTPNDENGCRIVLTGHNSLTVSVNETLDRLNRPR